MPRNFRYGTRAVRLPPWTEIRVDDLLDRADEHNALVTSTFRLPVDQARIMYEKIQQYGLAHQYELYAAPGEKILDVYTELGPNVSKVEAIAAMAQAMDNPSQISHHMSKDPNATNFVEGDIVTLDIDPASISNKAKFVGVVQSDVSGGQLKKFLQPPSDPAFHMEFPTRAWTSAVVADPDPSEPMTSLVPVVVPIEPPTVAESAEEALETITNKGSTAIPYVVGGAAIGAVAGVPLFGKPSKKNWWKFALTSVLGGAIGSVVAPDVETGSGD